MVDKKDVLINLSQAAELLGVHKETLRRWDRKGVLKAVKIGPRKDRRYKKSDIQKFINQK